MAKKVRKSIDKWKQKKWYTLVAPEAFGNTELKETLADDQTKLIGRKVKITLADIINDWSKQNIKLFFKIDRIEGDKAYTRFDSHELTRDYLRSLVRRRTSIIASNFVVTTSDGYKIRIKPCAFTLKRIQTTKKKKIRSIMENITENTAKKLEFNQFIQAVVLGKLASDIYKEARFISPLRRVDIGKTQLISMPMGNLNQDTYSEDVKGITV
ncbi:30S ribosomal protein S3ae [Candidatus Methanoliparum sp. LAM-1]|uniref:30S ribosomal protein S3ae n=1 Tax=Candidatus Methanoliparum sp. LAM-1 TaxID=2874846 RepID=UPI001E538A1F|nr:30S ribosomal protein S3ae [Candidatus Methanoliparum sp. LAM-1]BDC36578.1 30S ribosomal protein S3ae [Candidatus Methanoliparum sp. LAM-1]